MNYPGTRRMRAALLSLGLLAAPAAVWAETTWTTLGTMGGPVMSMVRGQPANLLQVDGLSVLVDAGDGALSRAAAAGVVPHGLRHVIVTHHHGDHNGGLYAVLAIHHQLNIGEKLTIYGPPGTRAVVDGMLDAMAPSIEAGFGISGMKELGRDEIAEVVELSGGDSFEIGPVKVTVAQNTHYTFEPGDPRGAVDRALSLRFQTPDRVVVYTGDTGPSDDVTALAKGADLLVTEMIDVEAAAKSMRAAIPNMPEDRLNFMVKHFAAHHLTVEQAAAMAAEAGVGELVFTHLSPGGAITGAEIAGYMARIAPIYTGKVTFATDMQRF